MIRKLLTVCAGVAMMSSAALALDVTGTYAGQANGQEVAVQFQESQGTVRGMIRIGQQQFPLAAQEQGGQIRGVVQSPDGSRVPFSGQCNGGRLDFTTTAGTLNLQNVGYIAPADAGRQAPAVDPRMDRGMPTPADQRGPAQMTVRMEQGQIFARPLPDGWKSGESCNETFIYSPDNSLCFGFTGYEGVRQVTPTQFMQWMIVDVYKHGNFQILEQHAIQSSEGGQTIEAMITYSNNGQPIKAWVRCNVLTAYNSSNGYMLFACAAPEKFEASAPMLIQMAEKIQITDNNAVFNRAARLGVIRSVKNNPIPDTIIVGYNDRQKTMDNLDKRRGEVNTNTYRMTDRDGNVYHVGQNAFDPAKGGVPDPQHPGELLKQGAYWNGH